MNEALEVVMKADPKAGDVIVLRCPRDYPMRELWDSLESLEAKGIRVLAVTDEIEITTIKADGNYLLTTHMKLPDGHVERIVGEWNERFPGSRMMMLDRAQVEEQGTPFSDGLDTL
jgi:hypothetical protein